MGKTRMQSAFYRFFNIVFIGTIVVSGLVVSGCATLRRGSTENGPKISPEELQTKTSLNGEQVSPTQSPATNVVPGNGTSTGNGTAGVTGNGTVSVTGPATGNGTVTGTNGSTTVEIRTTNGTGVPGGSVSGVSGVSETLNENRATVAVATSDGSNQNGKVNDVSYTENPENKETPPKDSSNPAAGVTGNSSGNPKNGAKFDDEQMDKYCKSLKPTYSEVSAPASDSASENVAAIDFSQNEPSKTGLSLAAPAPLKKVNVSNETSDSSEKENKDEEKETKTDDSTDDSSVMTRPGSLAPTADNLKYADRYSADSVRSISRTVAEQTTVARPVVRADSQKSVEPIVIVPSKTNPPANVVRQNNSRYSTPTNSVTFQFQVVP